MSVSSGLSNLASVLNCGCCGGFAPCCNDIAFQDFSDTLRIEISLGNFCIDETYGSSTIVIDLIKNDTPGQPFAGGHWGARYNDRISGDWGNYFSGANVLIEVGCRSAGGVEGFFLHVADSDSNHAYNVSPSTPLLKKLRIVSCDPLLLVTGEPVSCIDNCDPIPGDCTVDVYSGEQDPSERLSPCRCYSHGEPASADCCEINSDFFVLFDDLEFDFGCQANCPMAVSAYEMP